jgi:tRNA(fMet)-specific endonuclease VapC
MALIFDADVIIASERGTFDLERWSVAHADEQFEIAAITVAELWHGVERAGAPHKSRRERYLQEVLSGLLIVPYTEETAYQHARLWAKLETSGKMIGYYDVIVAATALERGSTVVTFNKRHFARVQGLTMITPE